MTATTASPHDSASARFLGIAMLAWISMLAAAAAYFLQWLAVGAAICVPIVAIIVWRPRYGLYIALVLVTLFESVPADTFTHIGFIVQSDVSWWTPLNFLNFSPLELILIITSFAVVARAVVEHRGLHTVQLFGPLLLFLGLIAVSMAIGVGTGGQLLTAIGETRALLLAGLVALLVPNLLQRREHIEHLVMLLCVAIVLLSLEIIYRRLFVLRDVPVGGVDQLFGHETPVFMDFVVLLLIARLIWPATLRQRLAALVIPLILYAQMLSERRAGWIGLDLGLMVVAIFIFRLRRKVFFAVVLPLLVFYAGYVMVFWNAQGTIAQPARAVRSITGSADARDRLSNRYRETETTDLRLNIQAHPITGLGFGRPYIFYLPLPDLSWWSFWHYIAHNSVLWLWTDMGPVGFIAFLSLVGAGIVRGVQLLKRASREPTAPMLVALVSVLIIMLVFSYVDLGLTFVRIGVWLGFVLGIIGMWGRNLSFDDGSSPRTATGLANAGKAVGSVQV